MARIKEEDLRLNIILSGDKEQMKRLNKDLGLTGKTLTELRKHLSQTKKALANAVPGTENWKKLQKEVRDTQARLNELNGKAKQTKTALSSLVKGGAILAGLRAAAKAISYFTTRIADFEQANANLATVLGKTVNDIKALTDNALALGRETEYTASEVTLLQTELAKLGFTELQILAMTESTLHFATAVGTDLPQAAQLAGATLRIFGLQASQNEDTLGVLAVATNKSALNFTYLQNAMSTVGPVARTFGFSVRDTTALLGTLANAGFDASSAATATRNILLNLANSSGKLAQALGRPVRTFPELMAGLQELNSKGIDLATSLDLTDKRSVSAFNSFLRGTEDSLALRDALEDVDGELKRIADERMNTVSGSMKKLQSAWEGFVLSFSNSKGVIKSVLDFLAKGINTITDMIGDQVPRQGRQLLESMRELYGGDDSQVISVLKDEEEKYKSWISTASAELEAASKDRRKILEKQIKAWGHEIAVTRAAAALLVLPEDDTTTVSTPSASSGNGSGGGKDKKSKAWSLQSDEAFLRTKAALQKQFNDREIKTKEEFDEKLYEAELAALTARLALNKEKGAARARLEEQLQSLIFSHTEKELQLRKEAGELLKELEDDQTIAAYKAELDRYGNEKKQFEKVKHLYEDHDAVLESLEQKHQNKMAKIAIDGYSKTLGNLKTALQEREATIKAQYAKNSTGMPADGWDDARAQAEMQRKILEARLESLSEQKEILQKMLAEGLAEGVTLPDGELEKIRLELQQIVQQEAEVNKEITGNSLGAFKGSGGSLFGVSEAQWSLLFEHLKEGKLMASDMQSILSGLGGAAQEGFGLAQQAIELTNAKEKKAYDDWVKQNDARKDGLKKRLDSGLMTQAQYDAELERMQAEQDAKQEEAELAAAKRSKTLAITQSIIETSLSVMKTFTKFGGWPAGVAPAAIMGALGAAQTAMIAKQPVGYAEGGEVTRQQDGRRFKASFAPGKRGRINGPTVIVGEEGGEYVIPAAGMQNPTLAPLLATMEAARRAGTLRNLDFRSVYSPSAPVSGRGEGGSTEVSRTVSSEPSAGAASESASSELVRVIARLNARLDEGIEAHVRLLGRGGFYEADENYKRAKRRANL